MLMRILSIGVVAGLTASAAAASDYVILDSTAEGIEPGIVVASNADIAIPEGAQIVLIDPAGETLVVEGPFAGAVSSAAATGDTSVGGTLESLTTTRGTDTTVLGAVRAPKIEGGSVTE
ncbi:MAG: hypothetical protein AAFN79_02430 [Pseudomonadota bacterium]